MRPRNDITTPDPEALDPYEVIARLRSSLTQWQAAAERIAAQRDDARDRAEDCLVTLKTIDAHFASRVSDDEVLDAIAKEVDEFFDRRVPDGASQATG